MLTIEEREVLDHVLNRSANQMYCSHVEDEVVSVLATRGLMKLVGKPSFLPDGGAYYTITDRGRKALKESTP